MAEERAGPRRNAKRGKRQQMLAIVLGGIAVIMFFVIVGNDLNDGRLSGFLLGIATFVLLAYSMYLYQQGERHFQPTAKEAMAQDSRAPVLYLRSFENENDVSSEEEVLAKILKEVGPFVAIGRPEDKLPMLGAARDYLGHGDWKSRVSDLMQKSSLVIFLAGKTEGLLWEMRQCMKHVSPENLVVLIQDKPEAYDAFRHLVGDAGLALKMPPTSSLTAARHHAGQFSGVVRFDSGWNGRFEPFESARWRGKGYEWPSRENMLEDRLRIAFGRVKLPKDSVVKAPGIAWLRILFLGFVVSVFLFLIAFFLILKSQGEI